MPRIITCVGSVVNPRPGVFLVHGGRVDVSRGPSLKGEGPSLAHGPGTSLITTLSPLPHMSTPPP